MEQATGKIKIENVSEPKNIYEFLEQVFGHEIFFIEDLMLMEGERKNLLLRFLNIKDSNPSKIKVSVVMTTAFQRNGKKMEKLPFVLSVQGKTLNLTAFRIKLAGDNLQELNKEEAKESFLKKFGNEKGATNKSEEKLSEAETKIYEQLKEKILRRQEYSNIFPYSFFPTFGDLKKRNKLITKLLRLGYLKKDAKNGWLENCDFIFPLSEEEWQEYQRNNKKR